MLSSLIEENISGFGNVKNNKIHSILLLQHNNFNMVSNEKYYSIQHGFARIKNSLLY